MKLKNTLQLFLVSVVLILSAAMQSRADAINVITRIVSDIPGDDAEACDSLLASDVDVCQVFVRFSDSNNRLHVIDMDAATNGAGGFLQVDVGQQEPDKAPSQLAVNTNPELACDSFVTIGSRLIEDGNMDCTALTPDFDSITFNSAGSVTGSWYCNNPPSQQGVPDGEQIVLVAQFVVAAGADVSGQLVAYFNSSETPLTANFTCGADDLVGDLNCDGVVNTGDVAPFALALIDPAQYGIDFPDCDPSEADIDVSGMANGVDIQLFISLLLGN